MFILEFNDSAALLRKVVDILKDKIPEGTLVVKPQGIFFQSLDASHVALVDLTIYPEAASLFDCDDHPHVLGVRLETLAKVFRCSSSRGNCRISYNEEEKPDCLDIEFNAGGNEASYEVKLVNVEFEELGIPDESIPTCQQTLSTSELQTKLTDMANFAEDMEICRHADKLSFSAKGEGANASFSMEIPGPPVDETTSSMFSLIYLQWFAKAKSVSPEALLAFGGELPMLLQFSDEGLYNLRFFLSPKISDTEE